MKIKLFFCIFLLAVSLAGQMTATAEYDPWWEYTTHSTCDVCGQQVPDGLIFLFSMDFVGVKSIGAARCANYMKPFSKREYKICFKCIFKALGVKPE